jgi:hypothetical protein
MHLNANLRRRIQILFHDALDQILFANTNECANKPLSGVFFKAAFVVTLNSLRSAITTRGCHTASGGAAARCSQRGTHHDHSQPTLGTQNLNFGFRR